MKHGTSLSHLPSQFVKRDGTRGSKWKRVRIAERRSRFVATCNEHRFDKLLSHDKHEAVTRGYPLFRRPVTLGEKTTMLAPCKVSFLWAFTQNRWWLSCTFSSRICQFHRHIRGRMLFYHLSRRTKPSRHAPSGPLMCGPFLYAEGQLMSSEHSKRQVSYLTFTVSISGSLGLFSITLRADSSQLGSLVIPSHTNLRKALADVVKARDMIVNEGLEV